MAKDHTLIKAWIVRQKIEKHNASIFIGDDGPHSSISQMPGRLIHPQLAYHPRVPWSSVVEIPDKYLFLFYSCYTYDILMFEISERV